MRESLNILICIERIKITEIKTTFYSFSTFKLIEKGPTSSFFLILFNPSVQANIYLFSMLFKVTGKNKI